MARFDERIGNLSRDELVNHVAQQVSGYSDAEGEEEFYSGQYDNVNVVVDLRVELALLKTEALRRLYRWAVDE